ncbi:PTI1-like tyrosine-protein kinase 3 [Brachypodium distachyon]|uniref:Protein kinase domain-containing protein n=1 Tax=Brachypodium distachyon TaxID=15368 RepID=I1IZ48_BRADI|nr:PTI1-like tyrosine-protein kinase 3 [Brachypodium distachyon]KQJ83300.1 hypothetical protein BRADI_5g14170v3 [Brachypodium distachyon]PNT61355.1 hypothetical protein BRADI_5g14170v3 [Brachypodium distachyon]|eukprot:XP_003580030.1 PTI1-like tyrosine-protein kinase 3 [Brachypodium distachyon]
MRWWESVKSYAGNLGCVPRIGRKEPEDLYSYPIDPPEKRRGSRGLAAAAEEDPADRTIEVPAVALREVNEITGGFDGEKLIGQGSYAKVYKVTLRSARLAVVKKLEKPSKHASNDVFLRQLAVASKLRHEHFVRLLGYTVSGDLRVLVYEFASMGTLHDALHGPARGEEQEEGVQEGEDQRPVLSWAHRVQIALDAARGLEYLHEKARPAVTHKDVRSTNVLLFDGMRAKIADYNMFSQAADMARLNRSTHTLGSFGYQAPEYAMTGQMTDKSDVYSFGIVLLELLTGRKPLDRTLPQGQRSLVNWASPLLTEDRAQECIDPRLGDQYPPTGALKLGRIAVQCLQYDPTFRPSMGTIARVINYAVVRDQQGVV